jgi:small subunit ribosomal protein S16
VVRIRLQRMGRTHLNYFRINAIEKRVKRDGKVLENLGWYSPQAKDPTKQIELDVERVKHWLAMGAQPSDTLKDILAARDLINAAEWKAEREIRAKAKTASNAKTAAAAAAAASKKK